MRTTSLKCGEFTFRLEIRDSPANPVFEGIWLTDADIYFEDVELERYACTHLFHKKFNATSGADDQKRSWALANAAEIIEQFKRYKALLSARSVIQHPGCVDGGGKWWGGPAEGLNGR